MRHGGTANFVRTGLVVLLLLVVAACGGGGGESSEEAGSAGSEETTASSGSDSGSGSGTRGTTKEQKARLERPSGTPKGNVFPPGDPAYQLLATGRCRELLRKVETWPRQNVAEDAFVLYRAAANACLQRWDDAERDFERLEDLAPSFSGGCDSGNCDECMRAVKEWLDQVMAARRDTQQDVELVAGTQSSPCPEEEATTTTEDATTSSAGSTSSSTASP